MSMTMLDVTLHIDEDTTHNERENLRDAFFNMKGVMTADYRDERPHLMIIGFDPENITTSDLMATVQKQGYHAELVAM